jgi:ABC-type phosphate transport system substrate-binding protein
VRKPSTAVLIAGLAALLAACGGGAAAKTYSRSQASRIVTRCLTHAGASSVKPSHAGGSASFGKRGDVQWGYVMSAGTVADVFSTGSLAAAARAKANACLQPYGWHIG